MEQSRSVVLPEPTISFKQFLEYPKHMKSKYEVILDRNRRHFQSNNILSLWKESPVYHFIFAAEDFMLPGDEKFIAKYRRLVEMNLVEKDFDEEEYWESVIKMLSINNMWRIFFDEWKKDMKLDYKDSDKAKELGKKRKRGEKKFPYWAGDRTWKRFNRFQELVCEYACQTLGMEMK